MKHLKCVHHKFFCGICQNFAGMLFPPLPQFCKYRSEGKSIQKPLGGGMLLCLWSFSTDLSKYPNGLIKISGNPNQTNIYDRCMCLIMIWGRQFHGVWIAWVNSVWSHQYIGSRSPVDFHIDIELINMMTFIADYLLSTVFLCLFDKKMSNLKEKAQKSVIEVFFLFAEKMS